VSTPRRWPLHPRPGPDEALSSWLARVAGVYGLPVQDLLRHNLGLASALADDPAAADLDWDPPAVMTSCAGHGCRLKPELDVAFTALAGQVPPEPAAAHAAAMDRRTDQGLTTGLVTMPRRAVHAGVWFRLLRTLLDELSMPLSRVGARSGRALERIWRATGRPVRAGLKVWRPFERLDWPRQEAMLEAAAGAARQ
jgi:TniQ